MANLNTHNIFGHGPEDLRFPQEFLDGPLVLKDGRRIGIRGWSTSACMDDLASVTIEGVFLNPVDPKEGERGD